MFRSDRIITIETKYNIGQEVWANVLGELYNFIVKGIRFVCDRFHKRIVYTILEEGGDTLIYLDENELFPTKKRTIKEFMKLKDKIWHTIRELTSL